MGVERGWLVTAQDLMTLGSSLCSPRSPLFPSSHGLIPLFTLFLPALVTSNLHARHTNPRVAFGPCWGQIHLSLPFLFPLVGGSCHVASYLSHGLSSTAASPLMRHWSCTEMALGVAAHSSMLCSVALLLIKTAFGAVPKISIVATAVEHLDSLSSVSSIHH